MYGGSSMYGGSHGYHYGGHNAYGDSYGNDYGGSNVYGDSYGNDYGSSNVYGDNYGNDYGSSNVYGDNQPYKNVKAPTANPRHEVKSYEDDKFTPLHPNSPYDKKGNRKKRSLRYKNRYNNHRYNKYTTKLMGSSRPYNPLGYSYPGLYFSPHYSYAKSVYYNYLNKRNRHWRGFPGYGYKNIANDIID